MSALRCAICWPAAGPSRLPALSPAKLSSTPRRGITFVPRKMQYRVSYKPRQPHWRETAKGTALTSGEMGLRLLWPSRIKQATFATMHQHLQRYTKQYKSVKIFWKRFPYRGVAEKGNEVKMGKGRGTFSYLADVVPAGRVLVELSAPEMTRPQIVKALRAVSAKCPAKCEIIDRYALPKVGLQEVPRDWKSPHQLLRGAHPSFGIVPQGLKTPYEMTAERAVRASSEAAALPLEAVTITQGRFKGRVDMRVPRTAKPSEWRKRVMELYKRKPRDVRPMARQLAVEAGAR